MPWWNHDYIWNREKSVKEVYGERDTIEQEFSKGCYAFFPTNRSEIPYWSAEDSENDRPIFEDKLSGYLRKPIIVSSVLSELQPWLVDIIFDQSIDAFSFVEAGEKQQEMLNEALRRNTAVMNFNVLLQTILCNPKARLVHTGRAAGSRRLQVYAGNTPLLPSLDSLSAGQASLLAIFSTILRYADNRRIISPTNRMTGIVLVDEIDSHLHVDLQYRILPRLIELFPKVQFIFTAHSPLFPLGMEKHFGEDGVQILEMPEGRNISVERFSEFLISVQTMKSTVTFENKISASIRERQRPVVICEGETDPIYLKTAAELLGFDRLATDVDWEWIGTTTSGVAKDGGKDQLNRAKKLLKNNKYLLQQHTVLLFDCDANVQQLDEDFLHVRVLDRNDTNSRCNAGIENLLPESVFEDRFFNADTQRKGADEITRRTLNKTLLCKHLCTDKNDSIDFEGFRQILEDINLILWPSTA